MTIIGESLTHYSLDDQDSPLFFRGGSSIECEEFIYSARQQAVVAGKLQDDAWMAQFVAAFFIGDALRWYDSLNLETQGSWILLRRALLDRYPAPSERTSSAGAQEQWAASLHRRDVR